MNRKSIILSASGLKNILVEQEKDNEFVFLIWEKKLEMNKSFAEFLSSTISHIHHSDPTI